jgi:hypothetical protein
LILSLSFDILADMTKNTSEHTYISVNGQLLECNKDGESFVCQPVGNGGVEIRAIIGGYFHSLIMKTLIARLASRENLEIMQDEQLIRTARHILQTVGTESNIDDSTS